MGRNWGIPKKSTQGVLVDAKIAKPLLTLFVSGVFGIIGAAIAVISFASASASTDGLFHGQSLISAVLAAGFGCWLYVWVARPRFAAQLSGQGDVFQRLLRFYVVAALLLGTALIIATMVKSFAPVTLKVFLYCLTGGAGAAAAFQTVLAFVPHYDDEQSVKENGAS